MGVTLTQALILLLVLLFVTGPAGAPDDRPPATARADGLQSADAPPYWKPPPLHNPLVYTTTGKYQRIVVPAAQDVLIYGNPTRVSSGALFVSGGRNVRIVGGAWAKKTDGASIRVIGAARSIFIVGVEIDASAYNGDAVNASGVEGPDPTFPDVYIQDARIVGVNGTADTTHADIYQPQGPVGNVFIDKLTGYSSFQGIFLDPDYPIRGATLSRINLVKLPNKSQPITYLLWLGGATRPPFPSSLTQVYVRLPPGQSLSTAGIAPYGGQLSDVPGLTGEPVGAITDASGTAHWPSAMETTGEVRPGMPPGGDFVRAGSVGLSYTASG